MLRCAHDSVDRAAQHYGYGPRGRLVQHCAHGAVDRVVQRHGHVFQDCPAALRPRLRLRPLTQSCAHGGRQRGRAGQPAQPAP
eukprot:4472645-Alexandrium_andersonii.AAC.1